MQIFAWDDSTEEKIRGRQVQGRHLRLAALSISMGIPGHMCGHLGVPGHICGHMGTCLGWPYAVMKNMGISGGKHTHINNTNTQGIIAMHCHHHW